MLNANAKCSKVKVKVKVKEAPIRPLSQVAGQQGKEVPFSKELRIILEFGVTAWRFPKAKSPVSCKYDMKPGPCFISHLFR